ncbi:hypothetical protein [Novosphingobium panipatense]|uniref:hypothetical protein n=1 Tax=Novosphingobium panipatense TaxID=428991 RepID=UPI0036177285
MLEAATYGIAYRAKPKARNAANGWIDRGDLTDVLRLLGVNERTGSADRLTARRFRVCRPAHCPRDGVRPASPPLFRSRPRTRRNP